MTDTTEIIERPSRILSKAGEVEIQLQPYLDVIPRADDDGMAAIARRILSAETIDEVLAPMESEGLIQYLGHPLKIMDIRWGDSDFENGLGVFFIIEAIRPGGEKIVTTTGSATVLLQLAKAYTLGQIPGLEVIPVQAKKETKAGYKPLQLVRVP